MTWLFDRSKAFCQRIALITLALGSAGCAVSPTELSDAELDAAVDRNRAGINADREPLSKTVTLYDAMARALKYNLDHKVEVAEQVLREKELNLEHFSLLPGVAANAGYDGRDRYNASSSLNLGTGTQNFGSSTSQEKEIKTSDIAFSWNILDFGLSYVRAHQAADKVLVQNELRRKVAQRVIEDVRSAYWRAASAQRLTKRLKSVEQQAKEAERDIKKLSADATTSPITALTYERELVEIERTIRDLQRDLTTAKAQLAALMNEPPSAKFEVADPSDPPHPLAVKGRFDDLVQYALYNRPELREVEYRKRINADEARAALLELLPGLQLAAGANFDSNDFLANNNWINWGSKASWNLIRVFSYPARSAVVEQQDELLDSRALAMTMAVMTQVYVSRTRYGHSIKEFEAAAKYRNVQRRLVGQIRQEAAAGRVAAQTAVREELNAVVAEAKFDIAYASTQNAYANLFASLGLDPYANEIDSGLPVAELSRNLQRILAGLSLPGSWAVQASLNQKG